MSKGKFPSLQAARHSIGFVWTHRLVLWRMAWPWVIALMVGGFIYGLGAQPSDGAEMRRSAVLAQLAFNLLAGAVGAAVAVTWHRAVLLGEGIDAAGPVPRVTLDARTFRYWGWVIVLSLLASLILVPFILVATRMATGGAGGAGGGVLLALASIVALLYGAARLTTFLPAKALDRQEYRLADAWRDAGGQAWPIAGGLALLILFLVVIQIAYLLPVGLIAALVGAVVTGSFEDTRLPTAIAAVLMAPLSVFIGAAAAGFMSLAYDFLVRGGGPQMDQPSPSSSG